MRISDWSSDVCSSDLLIEYLGQYRAPQAMTALAQIDQNQDRIAGIGTQLGRERCARIGNRCECRHDKGYRCNHFMPPAVVPPGRSEEHTSELQSPMRISYAVFCLKKKT